MSRAIGMYINANYYPLFVTFLNSVKYFGIDAKLKVYDYAGLNHLLREHCKQTCELIPIDAAAIIKSLPIDWWYFRGAAFKGLIAGLHLMDDIEILIDVDTVVLSDLENIFAATERGKWVATKEFPLDVRKEEYPALSAEFKRLLGYDLLPVYDVYNSGLVGFNKHAHRELIDNWTKCLKNKILYEAESLNNDQNMISHVVQAMKLPIECLDIEEWMPIHHRHQGVTVGFEDGKIAAYREGKRLKFYHYTGSVGLNNDQMVGRFFHATQDYMYNIDTTWPKTAGRTHDEITQYWDDLWEKKWGNAAHFLAKFFYDKGPIRCPKVYNYKFRTKVALLLNRTKSLNLKATSKEVYAVALAYDYITLLGYRWVWTKGDDWIAPILQLLVEGDIYAGVKTISWNNFSTDVTLTDARQPNSMQWNEVFTKRTNIEELNGVFIVIKA